MVYEFLTITHIVNNNSYELNNFEFIIGSVPLIRCTWTNRRRAVPFDPDRAIDCPDALSLPFVTEFWWRWLLPYFPLLQNSTTHLCPGRGASCTENTSLWRGGGLALWHLPLLSRNRAFRSSCSVALQPCCDLKFWTLFEVDLLSVPFALLAASIDCSHCYYHSRHAPARYLLGLLINYRLSLACCSWFSLTFSLRSLSTNLLFSLPSQPPSLSLDLLGLPITCLLS